MVFEIHEFHHKCAWNHLWTTDEVIWLPDILALSAPHEGYSGNAPCTLNLESTFSLITTKQCKIVSSYKTYTY